MSSGDGMGPVTAGYLAEFRTPGDLVRAAQEVRDAGYRRWDAHSPYPVHGLDQAMGMTSTFLPWMVFGAGATGAAFGLLLQWWSNAHNYPFVISGKPFFSVPANIPVMFELTVLFAAIGAFLAMLVFNGLPRLHHPVFSSERFRRATSDRFFISIEADDPQFDVEATASFLKGLAGARVERLEV